MKIPRSLESSKLGLLVLDIPDDDPDEEILGLKANWSLPVEGAFQVSLPDAEGVLDQRDWQELVYRLDRDFDSLMDRVPQIRAAISADVLQRVTDTFHSDEPPKTITDLEERMKLRQLMYFNNGEVRFMYELDTMDHSFGCVDLFVDLNQKWEIGEVYFDG